jgi:hypothetical protein
MGTVNLAAFRATGFVVPIHVKNKRATAVAKHFVGPAEVSKAPRSSRPAGRAQLTSLIVRFHTPTRARQGTLLSELPSDRSPACWPHSGRYL